MSLKTQTPGPRAFLALLLIATMFGANHVAARVAFNHGVDVATAVAARSVGTALVLALLVWSQGLSLAMSPRQRRVMPALGLLVALQSMALYAAVARLPVGLALLVFNTFPIWAAGFAALFYKHPPERRVLLAMPVILVGLVLALDVAGGLSALSLRAQWDRIGAGVGFALLAGVLFGGVLVLTQHEVAALDGRVRSLLIMVIVGVLASAAVALQGGMHWPQAAAGWWGLAALTVLYGTAFTTVFTLLPRLGVVGNSPIMNFEPVAALILAWWILDQLVAPLQWLGALLVVGAVMALGLRRR